MSRSQDAGGDRDLDRSDDGFRLGEDWYQRHSRIAPRENARPVGETDADDDWDARHGRRPSDD